MGGVLQLFYWHVEAVDLDGERELWSPTFVGYLWEYWQRSQLGAHVCMSEADLEQKANEELSAGGEGTLPGGLTKGLFPRRPVEWVKPVYKPPSLKLPKSAYRYLDKPEMPPLPARFQHHLFYQDTELEENLAEHLEGTEAWDAMLGTSDRLQAAARSVLQQESFKNASHKAHFAAAERERGRQEAIRKAEQDRLDEIERERQEELQRERDFKAGKLGRRRGAQGKPQQ